MFLEKRQRKRSFFHDTYQNDISCNSIIYLRYIIFRSDMGIWDNSRESRKGSKGAWSCIRAHDHTAVFPLCWTPSSFVQSRRHASYLDCQPALVPSQCTDKSSAGRTPDCSQRNHDDNTDKGELSWVTEVTMNNATSRQESHAMKFTQIYTKRNRIDLFRQQ